MQIKRNHYLNKLLEKQNNGLVKVITGVRRCGKSYLLFNLFKKELLASGVNPSHILEMNFDGFANSKYRNPNIFYPYITKLIKGRGKFYILLDEVQLLDQFEAVLNDFLHMPNVDIYVTGSNAKFLSKDIITEFRGRGDEVNMYPLTFAEFMSVFKGSVQDGWGEYLTYGGLPTVVLKKSPQAKIEELTKLFNETYLTDIITRHNIRHGAELKELLEFLSSAIGSYTNSQRLANTFASVKNITISKNTLNRYTDYLIDSFLINRSQRYNIKGKRYIGSLCKYYFTDMGLRNVILNFRQQEESHIMENIIYNELRYRGFATDVGAIEYNSKDKNQKSIRQNMEIDFVINQGSKRIYLQSALSMPDTEKLNQEQRPFLLVNDDFPKVILTKDSPGQWYTTKGILIVNILDYLTGKTDLF